jgi:hypothetical protein
MCRRASATLREGGNPALLGELRPAVQSAAIGRLLDGTWRRQRRRQTGAAARSWVVAVSDRGERAGGFGIAFASTMALAMLLHSGAD